MTEDLSSRRFAPPGLITAEGAFARIVPYEPAHAEPLWRALGAGSDPELWRYLPPDEPASPEALDAFLNARAASDDWRVHVLMDRASGAVFGTASFMRNRVAHGSTEVGCVAFSRAARGGAAPTDAMRLMAGHVFDELGYRRYEWKCHGENAASRRAAVRLGFTFEGVFRQDMIVRGRNRDTAWFSLLDHEWPQAKAAFDLWLAPENFDADGRQHRSLAAIRDTLE